MTHPAVEQPDRLPQPSCSGSFSTRSQKPSYISTVHSPEVPVQQYTWSEIYLCSLQVLGSPNLSFNKVVTVDGGGHCYFRQSTTDELQHCHLCCCILHGHSVWTQAQVCTPSCNFLTCRLIQMAINNLLCQSKRPVQPSGYREITHKCPKPVNAKVENRESTKMQ